MHNTVVAVFIKGKKLLMDKRKDSKKVYASFLMCPSGHIEEGESLEKALAREMKEELDIEVLKSNYLFTIEDIDPFSKNEFKHNFMLVEKYTGEIKNTLEGNSLKYMEYSKIMKAKPVLIVEKLTKKLHAKNLI
ncbi:MAG: NUDIX hydrolase [Candidatus Diapherotrites archaeon]